MSKKLATRSELGRDLISCESNRLVNKAVIDYIVAHAKGDNRPYLKVQIYGREFLGLLDSGCTTTVLGNAGWEILKSVCKLQPSTMNSCTVANGNLCEVKGYIRVPVRLRDRVRIFDILVVPTLSHSLILGIDFWCQMGIVPNLHSGEWTFCLAENETAQVGALESADHLSTDQRHILRDVIDETFRTMGDKLGCTTMVEHVIRTNSPPIKQRHYPLSPSLQKQVNIELEKMLADGIIEPSTSPWASPIVLVRKTDGTYRFCVNYKKLNEVSEPDAYPLPFVSSTLDKLRDARYLTTLDIKSAYWQIPMAEESRPLTAFVVPTRGLFQFKRMPFGLHNSAACWQRCIDRVLGVDLEQFVFVYLDDIVICTPTFDKHMEILREVLHRIRIAGFTLNRDKCCFCRPELRYLGYVVNASGLMVDPDKVDAILRIPTPRSVTEVRRIVGLASWYRRFVPSFSTLTAPLTALLKKNAKFSWDEICENSFQQIKNHLISAPVLTCPNFDLPFTVQTDASDYGLGAVLTQHQEDGEKVVCYLSRSLNKNERKFTTTEKECLAVLFAIEKLRPYIEGTKFTVVTDHFSLKWLFSIKDPVGRIARWAVRLQQYDFDIIHRKGKDHIVPDTLSRAVPVVEPVTTLDKLQPEDRWYHRMKENVKRQPYKYSLWRVEGEKLYKRGRTRYPELTNGDGWLEVIPKANRRDIIRNHHDPPTCGHLGIYKTLGRIAAQYYWPSMRSDVARYINRCSICLETKPEQKKPIGLMLSETPNLIRPWQLLSVDIVGPLPRSSTGNSYILSVSDCFSKFCLLFPLRNMVATTIVKILEERVILLFGAPSKILTDNGSQFVSVVFKNFVSQYKIHHSLRALYHPQGNPVERVHRVVKTMLASYVKDNHRTWDKFLPKVAWAIRSARHEVTGVTPNFIIFGRELDISGSSNPSFSDDRNFAVPNKGLNELYNDISERLKRAYKSSQKIYNLRRRSDKFTLGQSVWRRNQAISDASKYFSAKLAPKFIGPFKIGKIVSTWTYELEDDEGKKHGVWHAKDLKSHPPDEDEPTLRD